MLYNLQCQQVALLLLDLCTYRAAWEPKPAGFLAPEQGSCLGMGRSQSLKLLHSVKLELLNCFCFLLPSKVVKIRQKSYNLP